jgi:hypothetical protein
MTSPTPQPVKTLPPDPEAYDSVRAQHARARGLSAPYIAGGRDPDPETGRREERRYLRLLVIMVLAITLGGFLLDTLIGIVLGTR